MIKKLILSLFIVTAVGASAVVATRALLSDQVTLTANAFTTGSVDLQIGVGTSNVVYADTHEGFTGNLLPGQAVSKFFKLKNNGTDVILSIQAQSANSGGTIPTDKVIVSFTPWSSTTAAGHAETGAVKITRTLQEWLTPGDLGIPNITGGGNQDYRMDVSVDQNVSSGGNTSFDFMFTGTQVIPTPTPTVVPSGTPAP